MNPDGRIALAEIKGDLKLVLANQERVNSDFRVIRLAIEKHDARLSALETDRTRREGQSAGITGTIKAMWIAGGAVVTAIVVAALKKLGLL